MLSNPPYGKSWKTDLERMGGKRDMRDPRFVIEHAGDPEYSLVTRSSDGQMLFLANKLSKMKQSTALGSRIAEVHNGSSLFTGDAGQGESNIRRWMIENDWLEAIVALPLNMFYNTGIATYVWVLTNRKPEASPWQGAVDRRHEVVPAAPQEPRQEELRARRGGHRPHMRHLPRFRGDRAEQDLRQRRARLLEGDGRTAVARIAGRRPEPRLQGGRDQGAEGDQQAQRCDAPPVLRKIHKRGTEADPLRGLFAANVNGRPAVVEYEPDTDLRDTEQIPLQEDGGIEAFLQREVLPYAADAWYQADSVKVGYEISFTRYFYTPKPMRTLAEIRADILALEKETEGLLGDILNTSGSER